MYKQGTNQHKKISKGWTLWEKIFIIIIAALILGYFTKPTPSISPVSDNPRMITQEESDKIVKRAYAAEELKKQEEATPENIIAYISKVFAPEGTEIMFRAIHIAKNESGLKVNAKGYNCRYDGVSKACKVEDRSNAWSVDCGIFQHNVIGQSCPTMSWKENVNKAYKLYKRRGLCPWTVAKYIGYCE